MSVVSLPEEHWAAALADVEGVQPVVWDMTGAPPRDDIELVVPPYMSNPNRLARLAGLPKLRAVQLVTAGFEHALQYLPDGVVLANGRGIHDTSTAELAVGLAIAAQRGIPQAARAQEHGEWLRLAGLPSLADRKALIVGYGSIGLEIAKRLVPMEVSITAVASRARAGDDIVDTVHGIDELPALLPAHDVVFLILPLTDATRHLVDADFLARMPPNALLVNVARGGVVDTDALVEACASGRVRAALDVTDPEPLPGDHPLWRTDGVLITPHIGGASTAFEPRALRLLRRELARFAADEPLQNVVATGPQ
ncbi:2-hydroxyacid dehydrogenase [Flexivirga oryzae]|uniref:Phosphoglycerate dehydrogenase-like enzyme n=1 Tax=Flexivirga oryzae TaxID=1794944 RepID=A0A839N540_9MICO|nr:2-hydroxyacid dehydrogenase [Flexivirga oryzae]MBB2890335.1 phosphoglycerate dehydrogenase-like enzyme [Flexivirga oryzae]